MPSPIKSPCSPNSSSSNTMPPTPNTPRPSPPCKPTANPPPNTTIASVTVEGTTNATIDVEADAVASGVPNAATLGIRPTLARIARNLCAATRTPKHHKTAVSGTSVTRDTVGSGSATRWNWLMCPGTNSLPTWVGIPVRATVTDDPPHTLPNPIKQQFTVSPKQPPPTPIPSNFKHKAQRKALERQAQRLRLLNEATLLDRHISWAEDERTAKAKADTTSKQRRAIVTAHTIHPRKQQQLSIGQALSTTIRHTLKNLSTNRHVRFAAHTQIRHFDSQATTPLITFDSGADSHYLSETDCLAAGLPILRSSTRQVGVANCSTSTAKYVSQLPFPQLSPNAELADSFVDFPQSLMSVGKTCDDGTVAIFTQSGVTVHKDTDVLITCQGEPLLIGACDAHGCYRIPLTQHKGRWQPRSPSKKARQTLRHANSVYDLPSTEQAIRWMHAVCGYPSSPPGSKPSKSAISLDGHC
eukprot:CCRYP_003220-RA/>CCRYP_003220-RA protein AED:0.54 eAED:0.54 QI:0/0/0/0.5/1/1/2/0/469